MMDGSGMPETCSTCPYCGVGCGVLLRPDGDGALDVRGDPDHPANLGRLCSKGAALGETVGLDHRLLHPQIQGRETGWDEALDLVAGKFRDAINTHGPDSVAFYVSGQLLTEDYYVANKLMKGFIGAANIDTNSRLCMASTVAGHKRAFGTDTVPGSYEDIDQADLVVLVGSNLAWCHPVLHARLLEARKTRGTKIIVVDPRRTASCDQADLHLALAPGSDVALFNALLKQIDARGACSAQFSEHINGYAEALACAQTDDPALTGLPAEDIAAFCDAWIGTEKVVTIFSQGVNQSTSGTDKVASILNCHLATGRIGKPGCGPLSVTGQPNAMGGREVGGLANMLACHLDLENPAHRSAVQQFWQSPAAMPEAAGLKAVEMFDAVRDGTIKALWVIHTNPAVSMPDADMVRDAIATCPFTVVSDITAQTDTCAVSDVLLPASAWGEKDGTVTNSDRTISRQRAVLTAPGQARADWDILADVGRRMGWAGAFDYASPAEIFREYAALSGIAGGFDRDFDISDLRDISDADYASMRPFTWPCAGVRQGGRFFADGAFYHADGKAKLWPVQTRAMAATPDDAFPFRLNTGRIRDQWHTMTRTALSPRLSGHLAEPYVDMHPEDAQRLQLGPASLVRLTSTCGSAILRLRVTDAQQRGQLFAPMHWTAQTAPSARVDALVPAQTDPISGQPESKAAVVHAEKFDAAWYGFAVSTQAMTPDAEYWALASTVGGWRMELAGTRRIEDWEAAARTLFGLPDADAQMLEDTAKGSARVVLHAQGRLLAALYIAPQPVAVMRDYLSGQLGQPTEDAVTGLVPAHRPNPGPTLCACFGVGVNTILRAIEDQNLMSVDEIGTALSAGTNCGACRPELNGLLMQARRKEAAE